MVNGRGDDDARRVVAVLAPHPDDESIFCGGLILRLVELGHRVVIIAATTGDAGREIDGDLAGVRASELATAAEVLGASAVRHLGHADSGLGTTIRPGSFGAIDVETAAGPLIEVLVAEGVTDLILDPSGGIYPHPDHRQAHEVGVHAAQRAGIGSVHAVTVDREHLHFVETHLVVDAHRAFELSAPGAPRGFGAATVEIDAEITLDAAALRRKREAMASHRSQMPPDSAVMTLDDAAFGSVYGTEWLIRVGADRTLLDLLRA